MILKNGKQPMDSELSSKTIFIAIPSYEDPSLIETIQTAIDGAVYPERVFFGVGLQHKRIQLDLSVYKNLEIIYYDVDNRPGLIQVRNDLAKLSIGHDYFLGVDAHMKFMPGWDEAIINDYKELQEIQGDNVIISCQASASGPPVHEPCGCSKDGDIDNHPITTFNTDKEITGDFDFLAGVMPIQTESSHQDFVKTLYASQDFFFVSTRYLLENDFFFVKWLKQYNDEPLQSFLAFMRGWSVYRSYKRVYAYHNMNPFKFEETKTFASTVDERSHIYACIQLMLYNIGPLAISSNKNPEDFYKEIGLYEHFNAVVADGKYTQDFSDIIVS